MDFTSAVYGLFLALVFAVHWLLRPQRRARFLWLLAASYVFYGSWNAKYLLLIAASTVLDWALGLALAAVPSDTAAGVRSRKRLVALSVTVNLLFLGVFKYFNFFRDSVLEAAQQLGLDVSLPLLDVLLPAGISFYTFQSIAYIVDVYRGHIAPCRSLLEYALFIAFFPQLVAGPILRAPAFLPQLARDPTLARDEFAYGVWRICKGLGKKVLIADVLAVELVQRCYAPGSTVHGAEAWLAMYAFALQVYGDFSGYSDIAIGSARLFGFKIPENFDAPYHARSIQDFWRRWHISLSFWLRDYLYVPLGGNRKGAARTYVNLTLTMVLSGLWHGAGWHFVVWGFAHGVMLSVNRWWSKHGLPWLPGAAGRVAAVLLTFHLVALALVMFRAPTLRDALDVYARLLAAGGAPQLTWAAWLALGAGLLTHGASRWRNELAARLFVALPLPVLGALVALFAGAVAHFRVPSVPFVYFQF
jgi:D-alanyl-lipoteichoic acid acyltransferase DltB (MBOAT superfamily)